MPSLRKRMSTYFRQLSFHNEPRQKRHNLNENSFVTKYLDGHITLKEGPAIIHGKNPTDLPNYELGKYHTGYKSIVGCYSGPNGGLTTVKRTEKHLSLLDADIDFIDTQDEIVPTLKPEQSPKRITGQPVDNTKMIIKVAGQTYCVTNKTRRHSKSQSLGSISDFNVEIERTKIDKDFYNNNSSKDCKDADISDNQGESPQNRTGINKISSDIDAPQKFKPERLTSSKQTKNDEPKRIIKPTKSILRNPSSRTEKLDIASDKKAVKSYNLSKSKSEGNPFLHKKKGKIIKITERPKTRDSDDTENQHTNAPTVMIDDRNLPSEWNKKSDLIYGISDSLYDVNQVTKHKNGDPIADCFGIVARRDSAILAVADGVNWGEKASIAAKSAVHGCLHYLNKTIFNDTKLFENLTVQLGDAASTSNPEAAVSLISNTREVFICLLRAFNCAHDLILENKGMLTTLTVAVVLPLQKKMKKSDSRNVYSGAKRQDMQRRASSEDSGESDQYVCCVCNVGDTLAYVYSQKYGVRELTKGSHDINCNRDMRDALGALGPVDGINPELSNLTLSITTLYKGDIVLVASDGLTDNFDPNVCRFSVNCAPDPKAKIPPPPPNSTEPNRSSPTTQIPGNGNTPPQKPPRKSHIKRELERQLQAGACPTSANDIATVKSSPAEVRSDKKVTAFDQSTDPSISSDSKSETHDNNSNAPIDLDPAATFEDPLIAHFMRENSVETDSRDSRSRTLDASKPAVVENRASSLRRQTSSQNKELSSKLPRNSKKSDDPGGYKFLRSKTTLDFPVTSPKTRILRNEEGMAYVTPVQRYELQLLLMEDVLTNGISGREAPCMAARKLCENLVNFTLSITSAKRHTLEDQDLYFDDRDGVLVEVTGQEKKMRRKRGLEKVLNLPGKLDHVTVVACNVGNFVSSKFMNV